MNKQTIWLIVIFGCLLAWLTFEYLEHLRTYEQQNIVDVTVTNVSCGATRGSKLTVVKNKEKGSLEVTRIVCDSLTAEQQIKVLQSTSTGNFYWNDEPVKRFFWFYPIFTIMVVYMIHWNKRKQKTDTIQSRT